MRVLNCTKIKMLEESVLHEDIFLQGGSYFYESKNTEKKIIKRK